MANLIKLGNSLGDLIRKTNDYYFLIPDGLRIPSMCLSHMGVLITHFICFGGGVSLKQQLSSEASQQQPLKKLIVNVVNVKRNFY